jgi:hypothetical protein
MTTADTIDQWRHRVAAVVRAESDDPGRRSAARIVAVRSRIPRTLKPRRRAFALLSDLPCATWEPSTVEVVRQLI